MKPYPSWFKRFLLLVLLAVFCSGLLLVPTLLLLRADIALPWHLASSQRVGVAALHAGTAMLTVMLAGALWTVHMRAGWRKHRQRISGAMLCAGLAILALTALVLYYSGEEGTAAVAAWIHVGVGAGMFLPFVWHAWVARSPRRAGRRAAHQARVRRPLLARRSTSK